MKKDEISKLLSTKFSEQMKNSEEFLKRFLEKDDSAKPHVAAIYIKNVIGIIEAVEECFSGNFRDEKNRVSKDKFNFGIIPEFQRMLFETHYRIALVNREVHKVLNPEVMKDVKDTPFDEVVNMIFSEKQGEWFEDGFIPTYLK